MRQFQRK